jgi:hypothetical protein
VPETSPTLPGSNVEGIRSLIESLIRSAPADTVFLANAQVALTLARSLDAAEACPEDRKTIPALAKELAKAIGTLAVGVISDHDDTFGSVLPAEVRDSPEL